MSNRLINEKSPYLLEHAENPVDWFPWCAEAFEKAKREDKPIFLSIGYSTCHWCHVMARESFEDELVAQLLNTQYVSIKLDREERPDIDAVYMEVCTALNGSGGWPLTIIMTPEQKPFFAATYLPKDSRGNQLGLIPLLSAVAEKWLCDKAALLKTGNDITSFINAEAKPRKAAADEAFLIRAVDQLIHSYDSENGGFGTAPKFPSAQTLIFMLRYAKLSGAQAVRQAVEHSLQQMYRGGIYDHIGGGFSRYSTDSRWFAPHFEKTLYDNALLALAYTEAWQDGHLPLYRKIAEATLDYCLRELRSPEGGFYSGQDADSEGVEGKYYLFTPDELQDVLGKDDGRHFGECYDITEGGNFEDKSIPNLLLNERWALLPEGYTVFLERLREYRAGRCRLHTDTKQLAAWNGLMLIALARAGRVFGRADYTEAAKALRRFILADCEKLRACYYGSEGQLDAGLTDYSFLALGLLEMAQGDFASDYLPDAICLAEAILARFPAKSGGYYSSSDKAEKLIKRPMDVFDGALPSGNSAAAVLFDQLWRMTGDSSWHDALDAQLDFLCSSSDKYPAGCAFGLIALMSKLYPTKELICVCDEPPEMFKAITAKYAPELCVILKRGDKDELLAKLAPFTAGCAAKDGKPSFYVCENGSCSLPFTAE